MAEWMCDVVTDDTYSDQLQVTCVMREIMADKGDSEVKVLLQSADDEVNLHFSRMVNVVGKVDITQMTLLLSRI